LPDRRKYKGDFLEIRYDLFIEVFANLMLLDSITKRIFWNNKERKDE